VSRQAVRIDAGLPSARDPLLARPRAETSRGAAEGYNGWFAVAAASAATLTAVSLAKGRAKSRRQGRQSTALRAVLIKPTSEKQQVAEKWFESQSATTLVGERQFGSALAERGLTALQDAASPARNQEPWRYTDLDALLYDLQPSVGSSLPEDKLQSALSALFEADDVQQQSQDFARLVFVDGRLCSSLSQLQEDTATFAGAGEALKTQSPETRERVGGFLDQLPELDIFPSSQNASLGCAKLAALNQAVFEDAACICFGEDLRPTEERSESRVDVVFVSTGTAGASSPRLLVDAGRNRQLQVVETHLSLDQSDTSLSNGVCRVRVGEGAKVRHEFLQQKAPEARLVETLTAEVSAGGSYELRVVQSGARSARVNVAIALLGESSSCDLTGAMIADQKQQLDLHSVIHHSVPSCRSGQRQKNMVSGSAECIFKGSIKVDKLAQKTLSSQICRSLLLTKKSKVKVMPSLQIQADDVQCSHGAALTQLDPEQVFYMASRGLDGRDARRLMLIGFPEDVLQGLKETSPTGYKRVMDKLAVMAENAVDP